MKVVVCLPSFNEKQNIRNITQTVDQGLTDLALIYRDAQIEIINFDSNSTDGTSDIFIKTKTKHFKHSIVIKDGGGKGKNILEFCKYAVKNNVDYCLTIDSDITSATPNWITKLIQPLINNNADYVTSIYKRSRFEGSSTNHFAFPFVYALTGHVIHQPIAGDFAFTKKIALAIFKSEITRNKSVQLYGIDIFMTLTAINVGRKVCQVDLGKKVHAPSFSKLEYMFPQIATSALLSINSINFLDQGIIESETRNNILSDLLFPHKKVAQEMKQNALINLNNIESLDWADSQLISKYKNISSKMDVNEDQMVNIWISILSCWINHFSISSLTPVIAKQAGEELLPFFVLRATNFWLWAETVKINEIEAAIKKQAKILRDKIKIL